MDEMVAGEEIEATTHVECGRCGKRLAHDAEIRRHTAECAHERIDAIEKRIDTRESKAAAGDWMSAGASFPLDGRPVWIAFEHVHTGLTEYCAGMRKGEAWLDDDGEVIDAKVTHWAQIRRPK